MHMALHCLAAKWRIALHVCRVRRIRYLGQLLEGQDSIISFERGIDIMRGELQGQVGALAWLHRPAGPSAEIHGHASAWLCQARARSEASSPITVICEHACRPAIQEADGEAAAALSGALCALAEAHMHAADVEQVGQQVEALLREALQLGPSPEPLQVTCWKHAGD